MKIPIKINIQTCFLIFFIDCWKQKRTPQIMFTKVNFFFIHPQTLKILSCYTMFIKISLDNFGSIWYQTEKIFWVNVNVITFFNKHFCELKIKKVLRSLLVELFLFGNKGFIYGTLRGQNIILNAKTLRKTSSRYKTTSTKNFNDILTSTYDDRN